VEVVCLSEEDRRLLAARCAEHGNSHREMTRALSKSAPAELLERLRALRRLEHHFSVDLGWLCHRYQRRTDPGTHPLEKMVLTYVAQPRRRADGAEDLWVLLDRIRQVRTLVEPESWVCEPDI
jgi:hypothetical protein